MHQLRLSDCVYNSGPFLMLLFIWCFDKVEYFALSNYLDQNIIRLFSSIRPKFLTRAFLYLLIFQSTAG